MQDMQRHRAWTEISLRAIEHNYREICRQSKSPVLCVVKADAYGHGAVRVAQRLQELGAPYFAAATVPEAVELREHGISAPIMILGYVHETDMEDIARYQIAAPVYDRETAELLSAAADRAGIPITVHYKLDTGMTRLGFPSWEAERTVSDILACSRLPGLKSEGIFTHFADADTLDGGAYTARQYERFCSICEALSAAGLDLPLRHCANSGAIQQYESMHGTMTRAGIILYGYRPDPAVPPVLDLVPAMAVKARVVQVREIPAQTAISYGRTFETREATRVAVLAIGYADGFLRTGSGKAQVLLGGVRTPVLGRICMDMCMARIPDGVTVRRGDVATVFGAEGLTADDVAAAASTISYEVLCAMRQRMPRIYVD